MPLKTLLVFSDESVNLRAMGVDERARDGWMEDEDEGD
jgi:hypothetical protein